MMTTSKTFGTSSIQNPRQIISEVSPPVESVTPVELIEDAPPVNGNLSLINEYIEKFLRGEITEKQLNTIKKTLNVV
jgi:hypothetical protein